MPLRKPAAPEGYRWVSCSKDLSWDAARYRHLVRVGGLDTRCGHSASFADVWRANYTKPECPSCVTYINAVCKPQRPSPAPFLTRAKAPEWVTA